MCGFCLVFCCCCVLDFWLVSVGFWLCGLGVCCCLGFLVFYILAFRADLVVARAILLNFTLTYLHGAAFIS